MQSHVIKEKERQRPDVNECEQFGVFDVRWIFQSLKKVIENRQKLLTLVTLSRCKEQQNDAVFENANDLTLRVEFILVPVVLHQNSVQEQVHHDEGNGWERPSVEKRWGNTNVLTCATIYTCALDHGIEQITVCMHARKSFCYSV